MAKGERSKRQRVKQTEFNREREPLSCVHFRPLGFRHLHSLPMMIVAVIMPLSEFGCKEGEGGHF